MMGVPATLPARVVLQRKLPDRSMAMMRLWGANGEGVVSGIFDVKVLGRGILSITE